MSRQQRHPSPAPRQPKQPKSPLDPSLAQPETTKHGPTPIPSPKRSIPRIKQQFRNGLPLAVSVKRLSGPGIVASPSSLPSSTSSTSSSSPSPTSTKTLSPHSPNKNDQPVSTAKPALAQTPNSNHSSSPVSLTQSPINQPSPTFSPTTAEQLRNSFDLSAETDHLFLAIPLAEPTTPHNAPTRHAQQNAPPAPTAASTTPSALPQAATGNLATGTRTYNPYKVTQSPRPTQPQLSPPATARNIQPNTPTPTLLPSPHQDLPALKLPPTPKVTHGTTAFFSPTATVADAPMGDLTGPNATDAQQQQAVAQQPTGTGQSVIYYSSLAHACKTLATTVTHHQTSQYDSPLDSQPAAKPYAPIPPPRNPSPMDEGMGESSGSLVSPAARTTYDDPLQSEDAIAASSFLDSNAGLRDRSLALVPPDTQALLLYYRSGIGFIWKNYMFHGFIYLFYLCIGFN
jgi:hypothetical protein